MAAATHEVRFRAATSSDVAAMGQCRLADTAAGPAEPMKGMDTLVVLLTLDDNDLYGAEDDD